MIPLMGMGRSVCSWVRPGGSEERAEHNLAFTSEDKKAAPEEPRQRAVDGLDQVLVCIPWIR